MIKLENKNSDQLLFRYVADKPIAPYRYLADRPWKKEAELATDVAFAFPNSGIARECTSRVDVGKLPQFGDTQWHALDETLDRAKDLYVRLDADHWLLLPTTREAVEDACYSGYGKSFIYRSERGLAGLIVNGIAHEELISRVRQNAILTVQVDWDHIEVDFLVQGEDRAKAENAVLETIRRMNVLWC